jgi:hypothetical protein
LPLSGGRFDRSKLQFDVAARTALATTIPLIAGALAGAPAGAVLASVGALNTSLSALAGGLWRQSSRFRLGPSTVTVPSLNTLAERIFEWIAF